MLLLQMTDKKMDEDMQKLSACNNDHYMKNKLLMKNISIIGAAAMKDFKHVMIFVLCFPFYFYFSLSLCCFSINYFFVEIVFMSSSIARTYCPYVFCYAFKDLKAFSVLAVLLKAVTFLTASLNLFFNGLVNEGERIGDNKYYFYYLDL